MDETRITRLSRRHCDVLRGVAALKKTKQIAADLGIAPGTVDGYIAEAVRILGATDRGDAARTLARYDRDHPDAPAADSVPPNPPPGESGGQSPWVVAPVPSLSGRDQPVAEPEAPITMETRSIRAPSIMDLLPIRRPGQRNNDLPVIARLLWIPAIAVILAGGFGLLANGLKVFADVIERLHLSG